MARTLTPTSSLSYHSPIGYVTIIPRPTLTAIWVDGVVKNVACTDRYGNQRFVDDIWLDKLVGDIDFYIVKLGCGTLLKFNAGDLFDHDGRRYIADFGDARAIDMLPEQLDFSHLKPFEF